MNTNGWINRLHALLTQANSALLTQGETGALYLEGDDLCLFVEAERNNGQIDITVTGLPLTAASAPLTATPLFLIGEAGLRYGVFNRRGQLRFQQVAVQPYQLSTTEATLNRAYYQRFSPRALPFVDQALVLLPTAALATVRQALLVAGKGCFRCANADGTIQVLMQKDADNQIGFTFQSQKRLWEQNPVALYQPPDGRQRIETIGSNATMQWDASREQYCATIPVDPTLLQNDGLIALPLQPFPLELWRELAAAQPAASPAIANVAPSGLLATVSEAVRRVWVRDTQNVIWVNFVEGFLGQSALQPALVVKGDPLERPGAVATQFSLGPDELGDLDLSVQAIADENPALCTLVVKAQIPSRWPLVTGVRVILLRNEEFCRADTDESGNAFFPALPIEQLKRIGFKIELVDPPD